MIAPAIEFKGPFPNIKTLQFHDHKYVETYVETLSGGARVSEAPRGDSPALREREGDN